MNKVNLLNKRWVFEDETKLLQDYIENAISNQNPAFNDRVIHGLGYTIQNAEVDGEQKYSVSVTYGFGNSPKGYRVVLLNETSFDIEEPEESYPTGSVLEFWLMPMKEPEGEWVDDTATTHPKNLLDSAYLVVTLREEEQAETAQAKTYALKVLRGSEYLGEFVDPVGSDLLRIFGIEKIEDGSWKTRGYIAMVENVAKPYKTIESNPLGSYHYQDILPELRVHLIEWVETNTRWRIADGRDLPVDSKLRHQGLTKIPNLDNKFLRSWGTSSGERLVGSVQTDAMQHLTGGFNGAYGAYNRQGYGIFAHISNQGTGGNGNGGNVFANYNFDNARQARVANENRPVNTLALTFYLT